MLSKGIATKIQRNHDALVAHHVKEGRKALAAPLRHELDEIIEKEEI